MYEVKTIITTSSPSRHRDKSLHRRSAYVLYGPLELEERVLAEAGKQIEAVAFALAEQIPAHQIAELIELAARAQNFKISKKVQKPEEVT